MKNNAILFNISGYQFTNDVREITITLDGESVPIQIVPLNNTSLWIVRSASLELALKDKFKNHYPMIFGVILQELHDHKTIMPIDRIRLEDLDKAFQLGGGHVSTLAKDIATGAYAAAVGSD